MRNYSQPMVLNYGRQKGLGLLSQVLLIVHLSSIILINTIQNHLKPVLVTELIRHTS